MRTRGCRVKPIGEILRFVGHLSFAEFHDAHRVRWYAVIGEHEFGDPEIAAADNSPDRKTLLVWLEESALLNVVPAADPLARLRIIKHRILAVDFMFDLKSFASEASQWRCSATARFDRPSQSPPSAPRETTLELFGTD
jgi:hypothetical protein